MSPIDPELYIVRIWRGGRTFRATVRRMDEEALLCAHSVQELANVLAGAPPTADAAAGAGLPASPDASASPPS